MNGGAPLTALQCSLVVFPLVCRLFLFALLLSPAWLGAADAPAPADLRPTGYVNDFAGVIEPEWRQRLEHLASVLDRKTKAQAAVVTLETLGGQPIEDFAVQLFEAWRIGDQQDRGLLLLLVIKDRTSRLEVGYGLEPIIPDGFAGSVLREMRPALRRGSYGEALYSGTWVLADRIAADSGVKLADEADLRAPPSAGPRAPGLATALVVLAIMAALFFGSPWWPLLLGAPRYRPRRRYMPGGGFGGYDGGGFGGGFGGTGGFGGFGGGRSGGGGASSGW